MESGRPSRKSRRRQGRRSSGPAPLNRRGMAARPGAPADARPDEPNATSGDRPEPPAPLARRRPMRSPRPEKQPLNLRGLLNNPPRSPERDGTAGKPGSLSGPNPPSGLSRVRPLQPVPVRSGKAPSPIIPIQARPVAPPAAPAPTPRRRRRRSAPPSPLLYATRILILGVGVGAIVGTVLSIWNPPPAPLGTTPGEPDAAAAQAAESSGDRLFRFDAEPPPQRLAPLATRLRQPLPGLAERIQPLVASAPELTTGVFIVDLDTGDYVDINGATPLPAASTVKVPILVSFLRMVDSGQASLSEPLTLQQADVTDGSGDLQFMALGSQFSALDVATRMITVSDNTATNMILRRVGGMEQANRQFQDWGITDTVMRNLLADLGGTNTTSARDLSLLLTAVAQGDLLSLRSRDRFMEIMQGTINDSMIPMGVWADALIAHKTGTIDNMLGDTSIVDMPNGRRYVLTVLVKRPVDDPRAQGLIQEIASVTYRYFSQAPRQNAATPAASPSPSPAPANEAGG